jgi:hypothetical protein
MNRREFVQYLAFTAAGAAALPKQIAAFEQYYDVNVPRSAGPYLAMDEVSISGLVMDTSTPVRLVFYQFGHIVLNASLNAFGGVYFWRAPPDGKIIASTADDITWKMSFASQSSPYQPMLSDRLPGPIYDDWVKNNIGGQISFIDSEMRRRYIPIDKASGRLVASNVK